MRVLIAHSHYRVPGGEDRYVRQLADLLHSSAHTVHLESRENLDLSAGAATAARMIWEPQGVRAIRRLIRKFAPDVVHLHNPYPSYGPAVHLATDTAGVPLVQTVHNLRLRCPNGLQFTQGAPCRRCEGGRYDNAVRHECFPTRGQAAGYAAALWIHRFVMNLDDKVDLFIAPSEFLRGRLLQWGIEPGRVDLVRNFTVPPSEPPPSGAHGLYLGRLSPEKGVDVLLRALAELGDPPFEIAGGGPAATDLVERADRLGLRRTRFLGIVPADRVPDVIARARYLVFPSIWDENAPLAALEAMGAARPIVASRAGGLPELALEGRGRLCPPGDPRGLAAAMSAYDDAEAVSADGDRARRFVLDECTPERHLTGLVAAYLRAGTGRRSKASVSAPVPSSPAVLSPAVMTASRVAKRHPRVLMVHSYYRDLGGENLSFQAEVDLLRDRGVDVVTYTRENRELDGASPAGKVAAGLASIWSPGAYGALRDLVRSERPDLVHFQNTFPVISPSGHHAVRRLSVPIIQSLRNYRLLCANGVLYRDGAVCHDCVRAPAPYPAMIHACYQGSRPRTGAVVATQMAHRALGTWRDTVDMFVAPTRFARQVFTDAGFPADRIAVKPNFIDPDPGRNTIRGSHALFIGRLSPEKGVITMLAAWRDIPDLPLRIVGDGPQRAEVEAYIARHRLEDRVEVLGSRSPAEVVNLLRETRVAIFPSEWYETFGRVAAEALACGVPVVASRLGAMAELVTDGLDGHLFKAGDPRALADAVRAVLAAQDGGDAMEAAARATYEARFTAELNFRTLLDIYDRVLTAHRAGPSPAGDRAAT